MRLLPRCLPLLFLATMLTAAEMPPPADLATPPEVVTAAQIASLPPHPRLLADAARWEELRAQVKSDPASAEMLALLEKRAEILRSAPAIDYAQDPANILDAVREAERRILTFAMLHQLTGDGKYVEEARPIIAGLVAQPFPRGHFLDTAEAAFTLSIAYDWLYEVLAPAERETIAAKVWQEAIVSSVTEEQQLGWIWADHNWNQVCHGGLVTAAVTFADRDPVLARRIINRSLANLPRAAAAYAPIGIYPEGPTYWGFGTTYHVIQLEALRSALGTSEGLEKFPGFLNSAACLDQITGPTGQFFNYSDNRSKRSYSAAVLWFARENKRPDLAQAELTRIHRDAPNFDPEDTRELPLALLWWQPLPAAIPAIAKPPLNWRGENIQPVGVLRSAWDDPLATWLAIKGGTANHSHAHMDAGSFVFEALGVRWALDPVRDEYGFLRAGGFTQGDIFNYSQGSKRWSVFRLGPEGHNILRFDHAQQNVDGQAAVSPITESAEGASVEINLDSTYRDQAKSVQRRATLHPDASVTLTDTWTTLNQPAEVIWQWLTQAEASTDAEGVLLKQNDKALRLKIQGPEKFRVEIQPVAPLLDPKINSPAPDLKRVLIHIPTPAKTTSVLTVHLIPLPKLTK